MNSSVEEVVVGLLEYFEIEVGSAEVFVEIWVDHIGVEQLAAGLVHSDFGRKGSDA